MPDSDSPLQLVPQRGSSDCFIAALSTYLGRSYEDVLGAAVALGGAKVHHKGAHISQTMAIAKSLACPLHRRKKWDWDEASGILCIELPSSNRHLVVLRWGMVFDPADLTCWDCGLYLSAHAAKAITLLTKD